MPLSIERKNDVAVVMIDYPPVNALSRALRQELVDAVAELDRDESIRAVVLACAGRTFIAGADVSEFNRPPEEPHLPDVVARIESATKPWTAAIHGTAMGGGFEVALGCRYRVMASSAQVGLPEVMLGLVPGAGGTVLTPRLAGAETAVELATTGKLMRAQEAHRRGLVDEVVEGDLITAAAAFARAALDRPWPLPVSQRTPSAATPEFWAEQEKAIAKKSRGEVAPLRALACVRRAMEASFDDAMAFERETFLDLRGSDQAAALRHVFFAERAAPRPPEITGVTPRPVRRAAVVGGGTMGAGIAAALRDADLSVVLIERDETALTRGLSNLRDIFEAAVKRGRLTEEDLNSRMSGVVGAIDYATLADVDLVIEAVFEDLAVKRAVFAALGSACRADAVLATNTSYLDPRLIEEGLPHPERFIGLHFFSPAHVMKLLEIIPTEATAADVLATAFALGRDLKKYPCARASATVSSATAFSKQRARKPNGCSCRARCRRRSTPPCAASACPWVPSKRRISAAWT